MLIENAVAEDEKMLEKYFEVGEEGLSEDEIKQAIRTAVLTGKFFAVTGGDGRGVIVEKVLDLVNEFLPSPLDRGSTWGTHPKTGDEIERKPSEAEPFAALAFKIATDPFVGKLAYFRVYSGKIDSRQLYLKQLHRRKRARRPHCPPAGRQARRRYRSRSRRYCRHCRPQRAPLPATRCATRTTRLSWKALLSRNRRSALPLSPRPRPTKKRWAWPCSAWPKKTRPSASKVDDETGQTIISGMGELHLEIIVDRMKREFTVEANIGQPQVAYRETIRKDGVEVQGKFIRQSGGRGQYGDVWLRLSQNEARQRL